MGASYRHSLQKSTHLNLRVLRWYGGVFVILAVASAVGGFQLGRWNRLGAHGRDRSAVETSVPAPSAEQVSDPGPIDYSPSATLDPQQQAEGLLEGAIDRQEKPLELIRQNVDGWRGHLVETDRLFDLVFTALNSNDLRVRTAAVEIDLAANNLSKSPESVLRLLREIRSNPAECSWALWRLGALGNRGVQPKMILSYLLKYARDPNEHTRAWAVEGLAMLASDGSIDPLLERFAHDRSAGVRQRAAYALAHAGMLTREQRLSAVPALLNFLDDDSLDLSTRGWVYQTLRSITGAELGNNPDVWREWWAHHDKAQRTRVLTAGTYRA